MIVLDTSVLIDHLRGVDIARDTLEDALERGEALVGSVLTKIELVAGMRSHERSSIRTLIDRLPWIALDDEIANEAGRLARRYRRSHPGVGIVDFAIAATVQAVGGELWTRNVRHFPMFSALRPPYQAG